MVGAWIRRGAGVGGVVVVLGFVLYSYPPSLCILTRNQELIDAYYTSLFRFSFVSSRLVSSHLTFTIILLFLFLPSLLIVSFTLLISFFFVLHILIVLHSLKVFPSFFLLFCYAQLYQVFSDCINTHIDKYLIFIITSFDRPLRIK